MVSLFNLRLLLWYANVSKNINRDWNLFNLKIEQENHQFLDLINYFELIIAGIKSIETNSTGAAA
jgi:hypothetical protein